MSIIGYYRYSFYQSFIFWRKDYLFLWLTDYKIYFFNTSDLDLKALYQPNTEMKFKNSLTGGKSLKVHQKNGVQSQPDLFGSIVKFCWRTWWANISWKNTKVSWFGFCWNWRWAISMPRLQQHIHWEMCQRQF